MDDPNDMEDDVYGAPGEQPAFVYMGLGVAPVKGESGSNVSCMGGENLLGQ